jgi:hypothetical protein
MLVKYKNHLNEFLGEALAWSKDFREYMTQNES